MNPMTVSLVVFGCVLGGTLGGIWLRGILPKHHLDAESKDTVKVGIGLIATMTALVLGLVTASAKSSFDSTNATVKQAAMTILAIDRALARYGPEAEVIRKNLQQALKIRIEQIWGQGLSTRTELDATNIEPGLSAERLAEDIRALTPHDESQRTAQARALELIEALLQARWLVAGGGDTSVPVSFLSVLVFWLTLTFASFGVFAPRNATVLAVLIVCALSVSSALFLVLEMDGPFDGLIKASADPLRYALAHINQ